MDGVMFFGFRFSVVGFQSLLRPSVRFLGHVWFRLKTAAHHTTQTPKTLMPNTSQSPSAGGWRLVGDWWSKSVCQVYQGE